MERDINGTLKIQSERVVVDRKRGYVQVYIIGVEKPYVYAFNPRNPWHKNIGEYYKRRFFMNCKVEYAID